MSNVKIPEKHYVGIQKRKDDTLPLGFMTPWGTDAAAKNRMASVDRWAGRGKLASLTIDNTPMNGFKLTKSIRTTDYGGYDHWRIEDPRGFELEISSGNLAQLLSVGTIEKGEILNECVWARFGANNILLSTETQEYKDAVKNTEIANKTTAWNTAKPGNKIVLKNNLRGTYLGKMYMLGYIDGEYNVGEYNVGSLIGDNRLRYSDKPVHVIYDEKKNLHFLASAKLSEVEDNSIEMTSLEAANLINKMIFDREPETIMYNGHWSDHFVVSNTPVIKENVTLELVQITDPSVISEHSKRLGVGIKNIFAKMTNGVFGEYYNSYRQTDQLVNEFSYDDFLKHELKSLYDTKKERSYYFGSGVSYSIKNHTNVKNSDIEAFYFVQANITNKTGDVISGYI